MFFEGRDLDFWCLKVDLAGSLEEEDEGELDEEPFCIILL